MDVNSTTRSQLPALHYLADHAEAGYHAHITIYDASGKAVGSEWITPQSALAVKRIVAGNEAHERALEKTRLRTEKYYKRKIDAALTAAVSCNRDLHIIPTPTWSGSPSSVSSPPSLPHPWGPG